MSFFVKSTNLLRVSLRYCINRRTLIKNTEYGQQYFQNLLPTEPLNKEQWEQVRARLFDLKYVNIKNDGAVMDLCLKNKLPHIAQSYYQFLQENNYEIDDVVKTKYLQAVSVNDEPLPEWQQAEVSRLCDNLRDKSLLLNTQVLLHCIKALCLTKDWMKAQEMFESFEGSGAAEKIYRSFVMAALRHKQLNLMFKYLEKSYIMGYEIATCPKMHKRYLQYAEEDPKLHRKYVEEMLQFWLKYHIMPDRNLFNIYINSCRNFGWTIDNSYLNNSICSSCSSRIEQLSLTKTEYEQLKSLIVDKLFLFECYVSHELPYTVKMFRKFIARMHTCHLVIDGLNITYQRKSKSDLGMLPMVVDHFIKEGLSILVIGRQHLSRIPKLYEVRKKATIFLVPNDFGDDPFILYATLAFGPKTKFLSCDLMRNYYNKLPTARLKRAFRQWQYSQQYILDEEKLEVRHPLEHEPCSSSENGRWHIATGNYDLGEHDFDCTVLWHCLQPPATKEE